MPITKKEVKKHKTLKQVYFARADRPSATERDLEIAIRLQQAKPLIETVKRKKKKARSRLLDFVGGKKTQTAIAKRRKKMREALEE